MTKLNRNRRFLRSRTSFVRLWLAPLALLAGCAPARTGSIPSPDGTLTLVTSVNTDDSDPTTYLCVKFEILDQAGQAVYEQQTIASDRMRWSMRWEGNTRVVLESADVGSYTWEQVGGVWGSTP